MHRTRTKVCGCYRPEDARMAAAAGADAIGMILHAKSPRLVEAEYAMAIADAVPPLVAKVGVFMNAKTPFVINCARSLRLDLVQLHGDESFDYVRALPSLKIIKAVRVAEYASWAGAPLPNLVALLIDSAQGGSGVENDWDAVEAALKANPPRVPVFLAGGLKPENVASVVTRFAPYAVDVSSGVEARVCEKSPEKVKSFLAAVRGADVDAERE